MEWVRGQPIGHGTFSKVSLAKPTNHNSHFPPLLAIKTSPASNSTILNNELKVLNELKGCQEIVTCYGDCFTVENGERLYNVVLEYAPGGTLADKVNSSKNLRLSESDVRKYTKSILKGLQFIHEKGITHCDIKLQNVLVFSGDDVKIADFGLAKRASEDSDSGYEIRGTPMYMSPEMVAGGEQGPEADIWAVGCVVSEMISGKPAWRCSDICSLLMKIGAGDDIPEIPGKLSEAGKDFLRKCFVKERNERWTAEMLLNHPFINGEDHIASSSPRDPFDFPDWESELSVWATSFCSPESESESETSLLAASRLRQLVTVKEPDWSVTSSWVTVR